MTVRLTHLARAVGLPAAGSLAVVAAWWGYCAVTGVRTVLLPSPPQVTAALVQRHEYLARQAWVTLGEVTAGYLIAAVGGAAAATLLASIPALARAVWPTLIGLDAVPKLALAPLLVVWMGFGTGPKVVMVVLTCALPIVLATVAGLASTPREYIELARSLSAPWWLTLVTIRIPAALPRAFTGLKIAAPLAVIGAVIGELFGATAGLGYTLTVAGSDTPLVFATLLILAALSLAMFYAVAAAERLLTPWARHIHA